MNPRLNSHYIPAGVDIQLYLKDGAWVAMHYREAGVEAVRLFGTNLLPTPYTSATPAADVQARIQALNPGLVVVTI